MNMPHQTILKLPSRAFLNNLVLLSAIGFMLSGCVVHTRGRAHYRANATFRYQPAHVVVTNQPPKVRVAKVKPPQPSAAAVWVEGHWSWQNRWVWVDGRWVVPERRGYVWVKPVAEVRVDGRYVYHRGYWRAPSDRPAEVYVPTTPAPNADVEARGTVTTRPAPTRRVQVNVTPVRPPTVRASGNVRVSGNVNTQTPTTGRTTVRSPNQATGTIKAPNQASTPTIKAPNQATGTIKAPNQASTPTIKAPNQATPTIRAPVTTTTKPTVRASTTHSGTATATAPEGIKCSIKATRLSTGGYLTLQGQGLTAIKVVRINGKSVPLFSKRDNMLTAKVSVGVTSGVVTLVTNKNKTFSCGRVSVR